MDRAALLMLLRRFARLYGPGGEPPEEVIVFLDILLACPARWILHLVMSGHPSAEEELKLFVIAVGLRWQRGGGPFAGRRLPGPWDGVWQPAARWLQETIHRCMWAVSNYLEFGLGVAGYAFRKHPQLEDGVAQDLVTWFINGSCRCRECCEASAKGGANASNLKARIARCLREHNVLGWDPLECSFLNFVFQAVKGSNSRKAGRIQIGALVQGMHYYHLLWLNHIRLAEVLVWVCPHDGTRNFENLPCLKCLNDGRGGVPDPQAWRTVQRWLVVAGEPDSRFVSRFYWSCQNCRKLPLADPFFPGVHYYPDSLKLCPRCKLPRTRGAKQSSVYILESLFTDNRLVPFHEVEHVLADPHGGDAGEPASPADFGELPEPEAELRPLRHKAHSAERVRAAIGKLEKPLRGLVRACYFKNLMLPEIAAAKNVPLDRLEKLHTLAMQKLRDLLEGGEEGEM